MIGGVRPVPGSRRWYSIPSGLPALFEFTMAMSPYLMVDDWTLEPLKSVFFLKENHGRFGVLSVDIGFRFFQVLCASLVDETDESMVWMKRATNQPQQPQKRFLIIFYRKNQGFVMKLETNNFFCRFLGLVARCRYHQRHTWSTAGAQMSWNRKRLTRFRAAKQPRCPKKWGNQWGDWLTSLCFLWLSGWWFGTMEYYDFPYIYIYGNVIIPTDFHISEGLKPPTSYCMFTIVIMTMIVIIMIILTVGLSWLVLRLWRELLQSLWSLSSLLFEMMDILFQQIPHYPKHRPSHDINRLSCELLVVGGYPTFWDSRVGVVFAQKNGTAERLG